MSLGYSAALKRAAGQNELKKKGRGRKEDGGGDAELERRAVLRVFLFFKETLRERTGSGVWIGVQIDRPTRTLTQHLAALTRFSSVQLK